MKQQTILDWIVRESINGEHLGFVDVPAENDKYCPQKEEWWLSFCGGVPPKPIPSGHYLYYYREQYDEIKDKNGNIQEPDCEIEISSNGHIETMYLYKIRTDSDIIDKACKWIEIEVLEDFRGVIWDDVVVDFRNFMEGYICYEKG